MILSIFCQYLFWKTFYEKSLFQLLEEYKHETVFR